MRYVVALAQPKPLDALIEEARLATIERYRALTEPQSFGLSRLSREAAHGLRATQASVCFVDELRVWFVGAHGFRQGDVARERSFCDAVVRGGAALLVPNGSDDPRFRYHELVCGEPGVRSYAGVPLVDGGGYTLGTVAVYSVMPGAFQPAIFEELGALATLVRDFLGDPPAAAAVPLAGLRKVQGWLGVKTTEPKAGGRAEGLLVVSVAKRSPAAEAGLRPTDLLHSIDGRTVSSPAELMEAMGSRVAGTHARVRFRRAGEWLECLVEIRAQRRHVRVR